MATDITPVSESSSSPALEPENRLASYAFLASEILQIPLYCLLNPIIGHVCTVLTPGEFGNCDSKTWEIARRILLVPLGIVVGVTAVPTALMAMACNFVGDICLGNQPYLRLIGTYAGEKKETFATFNMSTLLPTMTLNDGVEYSHDRLKKVAAKLKDFHFVCGQEVDGASARFFSQELKSHFTEFYTYLGKSNAPLLSSGLFFASKEKVQSVTVIPFTGPVQKTIKRQLVIFELENYCVATMHLDSGDQTTQIHLSEINQAKAALIKCQKPVILCGDFNENRYTPSAAYAALTEGFVDCIAEQRPGQTIETCTDALEKKRFGDLQPPTSESIDYIMTNKAQNKLKLEFLGTEYDFNLSDHHLVKGKIIFLV